MYPESDQQSLGKQEEYKEETLPEPSVEDIISIRDELRRAGVLTDGIPVYIDFNWWGHHLVRVWEMAIVPIYIPEVP